MRKLFGFICVLFVLVSCKTETKKASVLQETQQGKTEPTQKIPVYTYKELAPLLTKNDGKTYVINFWATWCAPCVKELPYFEKLNTVYKGKGVEVILVSLDFPDQLKSKLIPFIQKKKLQSKVVLMVDPDQDIWIPKISKNWSGAIPATLIYNKEERRFFEKSFQYDELENELLKLLK